MKYISIFCIFVFIFSSCRTTYVSSAWGICGYEDPVIECEWMQRIIKHNKTEKLAISEVLAEKHIIVEKEGVSKYEKINGYDHAYYVSCKSHLNPVETIFDCEGNEKGRVNYVANGFIYYSYYDKDLDTYIHFHILETNVIYIQE